jgi:Arc/MetJ family transcription regulator
VRTNIVIDNSLMQQAMKATGRSTRKAVVEEGLRMLIQVKGKKASAGYAARLSERVTSM